MDFGFSNSSLHTNYYYNDTFRNITIQYIKKKKKRWMILSTMYLFYELKTLINWTFYPGFLLKTVENEDIQETHSCRKQT